MDTTERLIDPGPEPIVEPLEYSDPESAQRFFLQVSKFYTWVSWRQRMPHQQSLKESGLRKDLMTKLNNIIKHSRAPIFTALLAAYAKRRVYCTGLRCPLCVLLNPGVYCKGYPPRSKHCPASEWCKPRNRDPRDIPDSRELAYSIVKRNCEEHCGDSSWLPKW